MYQGQPDRIYRISTETDERIDFFDPSMHPCTGGSPDSDRAVDAGYGREENYWLYGPD